MNSSLIGKYLPPQKDDMALIEAPSMIVPYLHMRSSIVPFTEFVYALGIQLKHQEYLKQVQIKKDNNPTIIVLDDDTNDSSYNSGLNITNNNSTKQINNNLQLTATEILNVDEDDCMNTPLNKFFMNIGLNLVTDYVKNAPINSRRGKSNSNKKKQNNADGLLFCGFCDFKSDSLIVLANHMNTPHVKSHFYNAQFCSMQNEVMAMKPESLNLSIGIVRTNKYLCSYCSAEYNVKARMVRHVPICYSNFELGYNLAPLYPWDPPAKQKMQKMPFEQSIVCEICDGVFRNKQSMCEHLRLVHRIKIFASDKQSQPLRCHKCLQRFYSGRGLERHLLVAHLLVTEYWRDAEKAKKDHGTCTRCGFIQNRLLHHLKSFHALTLTSVLLTFRCALCNTGFNKFSAFELHVLTQHKLKSRY